jgi:3-methyl-2-oxobutanoate hydroxymethyltransferase
MLGLTPGKRPKFAKNFLSTAGGEIGAAFRQFVSEVRGGRFPGPEHCY